MVKMCGHVRKYLKSLSNLDYKLTEYYIVEIVIGPLKKRYNIIFDFKIRLNPFSISIHAASHDLYASVDS